MSDTRYLSKVKLPTGANDSLEEFELADKYLRDEFKQLNTLVADLVYPVGSVYWTSDRTFNPNEKFGGEWIRITNTFIYAADDSAKVCNLNDISSKYNDSNLIPGTKLLDTNKLTSEEGKNGSTSKTIKIEHMPEHNHDVIDNGHEHKITLSNNYMGLGTTTTGNRYYIPMGDDSTESAYEDGIKAKNSYTNIKVGNRGGGEPLDIMPPYLYRYCWERLR